MKWKLEPGKIRCDEDSILDLYDTPDFKVFEIDLNSKHPGGATWLVDRDHVVFTLEVGEDTRRLDESATEDTRFVLTADEGEDLFDWTILSEARRYTWRIVMYNGHPER